MKIIRTLTLLLGCQLLFACQSQDADVMPPDEMAQSAATTLKNSYPITNDVNSAEVDNIINMLFGDNAKSRSAHYDVSVLKDQQGNDRIICVNFPDNNGYTLISAVKTYEPILAYAETGQFTATDSLPATVNAWMESTMDDISLSQTLPIDSLVDVAMKWKHFQEHKERNLSRVEDYPNDGQLKNISPEESVRLFQIMKSYIDKWTAQGYRVYAINDYRESTALGDELALARFAQGQVFPIYYDDYWFVTVVREKEIGTSTGTGHWMKTTWNQEYGFNDSFPENPIIPHSNIPAGCGPVAIGQIMYAYRHPNTFDWDAMETGSNGNTYNSNLLLDIYYKCNAKYDAELNGTGTTPENRVSALQQYGYSCALLKDRSVTETSIITGCPAILGGQLYNPTATEDKYQEVNHAWVIEGPKLNESYREIEVWAITGFDTFSNIYHEEADRQSSYYLYANWGYYDTGNNGYYKFSAMLPTKEPYTKNTINNAIINIRPNK